MATARKKTETKAAAKMPMSTEAVAQRAYELFLARGGQDGHDVEDWLQAELELTKKRRPSRSKDA